VGFVDFGWLVDTTTNLTVALNMPPQALAIHLMSAIEGVDLNGGDSLGFHFVIGEGTATNPVIQTYIQASYFGATSQIGEGFTGGRRDRSTGPRGCRNIQRPGRR